MTRTNNKGFKQRMEIYTSMLHDF